MEYWGLKADFGIYGVAGIDNDGSLFDFYEKKCELCG